VGGLAYFQVWGFAAIRSIGKKNTMIYLELLLFLLRLERIQSSAFSLWEWQHSQQTPPASTVIFEKSKGSADNLKVDFSMEKKQTHLGLISGGIEGKLMEHSSNRLNSQQRNSPEEEQVNRVAYELSAGIPSSHPQLRGLHIGEHRTQGGDVKFGKVDMGSEGRAEIPMGTLSKQERANVVVFSLC
jgi:hypothetical protein